MSFNSQIKYIAIGTTLVVWVLCLIPLPQVGVPGGDKTHHMLAYATLMLLWVISINGGATLKQQAQIAAALVVMGLAVECAQGLTTYRFFEWADVAANTAGVLLGWMAAMGVLRVRTARRRKIQG